MILEPSLQTQLYGLDKIFNEIVHLFDNNKLPNKILLSGQKGSGKSTLSYHLANYIFSIKEENSYNLKSKEISINNTSYKLINNQSHPNFYLIDIKDDKKNIEISQIRKMINYANKSAFNNSARIIMINNVEHINNNSINALLKIIEEPNDNIFFILIHNNNKKILSTLRSRCLCFKLNLSFNESIEITNKLISNNIFDLINIDLINYYSTPGYYLRLINFARINSIDLNHFNLNDFLLYIIDKNFYKKDDFIKSYIFVYLELYFLKIFKKTINKQNFINFYYKFTKKVNETNKFNLDQESLFMEFKSQVLNG